MGEKKENREKGKMAQSQIDKEQEKEHEREHEKENEREFKVKSRDVNKSFRSRKPKEKSILRGKVNMVNE